MRMCLQTFVRLTGLNWTCLSVRSFVGLTGAMVDLTPVHTPSGCWTGVINRSTVWVSLVLRG